MTLSEAVQRLRSLTRLEPRAAIVLGRGMLDLASELRADAEAPLEELLGLPSGAPGAAAKIRLGRIEGLPVALLDEALRRHDGHPLSRVAASVRLMRLIAAEGAPPALLVAGACESLLALSEPGELALLDDHVNFLGESPLTGPNDDALGPRFPDMSEPYDRALQGVALEEALKARVPLHRGVYVAVQGPQRPTRAEYRMFRRMGGDFVGNEVVPEVIAARHMGMPVLALLAVAAVRLPDAMAPADPEGERRALERARPLVRSLLRSVCGRLAAEGAGAGGAGASPGHPAHSPVP